MRQVNTATDMKNIEFDLTQMQYPQIGITSDKCVRMYKCYEIQQYRLLEVVLFHFFRMSPIMTWNFAEINCSVPILWLISFYLLPSNL